MKALPQSKHPHHVDRAEAAGAVPLCSAPPSGQQGKPEAQGVWFIAITNGEGAVQCGQAISTGSNISNHIPLSAFCYLDPLVFAQSWPLLHWIPYTIEDIYVISWLALDKRDTRSVRASYEWLCWPVSSAFLNVFCFVFFSTVERLSEAGFTVLLSCWLLLCFLLNRVDTSSIYRVNLQGQISQASNRGLICRVRSPEPSGQTRGFYEQDLKKGHHESQSPDPVLAHQPEEPGQPELLHRLQPDAPFVDRGHQWTRPGAGQGAGADQ